ncbi:hypothetical protein DFH06DRAFT_1253885 [Mycena polygramma]|nr:hypothetical protein DFH06DRAFT_1253885 [Mycena polygramma]
MIQPLVSFRRVDLGCHTSYRILRFFTSPPNAYADAQTAVPETPPISRVKRHCFSISTLNSMALQPGDHVDLSGRRRVSLRFPGSKKATTGSIQYHKERNQKNMHIVIPFPRHSSGFLYYHRAPDAAPLEGSIRLRVTPDGMPSSFPLGHDLASASGLQWQLLLLQLASQKLCTRICDQLIYENLVSPEQLARCRAITFNRLFPSLTLFRLDQPFPVNFGSPVVLVFVGQALHRLELRSIFHTSKHGVQYAPWAGSAIARFEPSTDTGRRIVHLRILKITTPVSCTVKNYDGRLVKPKAGQLLAVRSPKSGDSEAPWKCDIDARDSAPSLALRALWDASAAAGYLAPLWE